MKLTLRWLAEFVDLPTSDPAEIAAAFERLGHEMVGYQPLVADFERVVIGQVIAVAAHPNADRLRVCTVDAGDAAGVADIVCGAWNFEADAVVPVALPGARVGELAVARRTIRTVVSNGMICSERELGLGDDHTGIMVLDADFPEAGERIGADFATLLDLPDVVFDLTITPNRPDCMSVLGLARELGALFRVEMRQPVVTVAEEPPVATTAISIADPVGCPRFVGRELRHVTVGSSPLWIRLRLRAAGIRPINNVVDASNYAMVELGHPTHAFDLDRLGDTVVVRRAAAGERLMTLDDQDRALHEVDMVVADADRPVAIAGVMGGAGTEIGDDSTRILIEAAYWDPPSILVTSRRLGLRSEASARFERGMDPNFCHVAADRVAQLLQQTAGAAVVANRIDVYPLPIDPVVVTLGSDDIERHLGISLGLDTAAELLRRLGCDVAPGDPLVVTVPTRRRDIERTIDLVEEVARLHGFDGIPDRVRTGRGGALPAVERNRRRLRRFMAGAGYHETAALSFIGASDLDALDLPVDDGRRNGIAVVNPLHDGQGVMRTTLLPGLIAAAARNVSHRIDDVALFETGLVFLPALPIYLISPSTSGSSGLARWAPTSTRPAVLSTCVTPPDCGRRWPLPWASPGRRFARGRLPSCTRAAVPRYWSTATSSAWSASCTLPVADRAGLPGRVVIGEIAMAPLIADRPSWRLEPPSPFPPNIFDLAFEIGRTTPVGDLLEAIAVGAGDLFESLRVFDVFTGGPVAAGRRSIAVRLTLRAPDHTLTDHELTPVRRHIVATVLAATGATLRGEV